jgi:hypothetical protein
VAHPVMLLVLPVEYEVDPQYGPHS